MCDDSCASNAPRSFWSVQGRGAGGGGVVQPQSVPLSDGCQTPFEGFHLQVLKK